MSIETLRTRVNTITDELTILQSKLSESFDEYAKKQTGANEPILQSQIASLKEQKNMFDRLFQEKEATLQVTGGKTRQQTLQEYNLLFFYISYLVFATTIAIYQAVNSSSFDGAKTFGLLLLALLPITGILIKFL